MKLSDILSLSFESLRIHRLRTGLTLAGIGIGVTAVLLLTALGEGAKAYIVNEFAGIGTNLVIVIPGKVETSGVTPPMGGSTQNLTIDDMEAIRHQCSAVRQVAPISMGSGAFEFGGKSRTIRVLGSTPEMAQVRKLTVAQGEFLPPGDPRTGDRVCVIGPTIKREVFGAENPLGKSVRISETRFRVIGVLASKGQSLGFDYDDLAIVPVATGMKLYDQVSLFRIMVEAVDASAIPAAMKQVKELLIRRHDNQEDFTLLTQDAMIKTFGAIIDALTAALAGIAAISLAVAGIGIMNIMLVSVSERTTEVGLLKALGAKRPQILAVFLVEALTLSLLGAVLGIASGLALILAAAQFWPDFPIRPSVVWIAAVLVLAVASGAGFGLMPARRAARLDAAEALRGRL